MPSVLEPSLVGHERRGALERGALRVLCHAESLTVATERCEPQLREHPHQPARERRGPRLRPVSAEQRLARFTTHHRFRAQGAVESGQWLAQVEIPFVYP